MISIASSTRIFFAISPTDMRKRVERNPGFTLTRKLATSDRFANLLSHTESQLLGMPA